MYSPFNDHGYFKVELTDKLLQQTSTKSSVVLIHNRTLDFVIDASFRGMAEQKVTNKKFDADVCASFCTIVQLNPDFWCCNMAPGRQLPQR